LAELGFVGGLLALAAMVAFVVSARRSVFLPDRYGADFSATPYALLGLLGVTVCSQFAYPLFTTTATYLAALLAGVVISREPQRSSDSVHARIWPSLGLWRFGIVAATAGWLVWSVNSIAVAKSAAGIEMANSERDYDRVKRISAQLSSRAFASKDHHRFAAIAEFHLGDFSAAARECEKHRSYYPADANVLMLAAQAYQRLGDLTRAQERIDKAVRLVPGRPEPWRIRAGLHLQQGDLDRAISNLDTAVKLAPGDALHLAMLGTLLINRDVRLAEAASLIERAMRLEPKLQEDKSLHGILQRAKAPRSDR
jgi:tetratricopeptide (TPR) repeat protein